MRLIDADDFKKFLQALFKAGAPYEEVIQLLDNQPTAFDTEKVVDQLEEASYLVKPRGRSFTDYADTVVDIGDAIDIVKKGGVE